MDNAMVVLHLALFSYLVSVTIAWVLIHLIGEKSGVPHALKAEVIIYPIIFSILKGLLPGMLVAALLSNGFGVSGPISMVPVAGGAVISGLLFIGICDLQ